MFPFRKIARYCHVRVFRPIGLGTLPCLRAHLRERDSEKRVIFGSHLAEAQKIAWVCNLCGCFAFCGPPAGQAYAVLSHEAIIDSAWDISIKPLLLQRFPHATPEELKVAHAYAYGGAIIQDMGYYPHGSKFVQRSYALRAQRRFRDRAAARLAGFERLRLRARGPGALRRRQ